MMAGGGELPISYASQTISFTEPLLLRVKPRRRKLGTGEVETASPTSTAV